MRLLPLPKYKEEEEPHLEAILAYLKLATGFHHKFKMLREYKCGI